MVLKQFLNHCNECLLLMTDGIDFTHAPCVTRLSRSDYVERVDVDRWSDQTNPQVRKKSHIYIRNLLNLDETGTQLALSSRSALTPTLMSNTTSTWRLVHTVSIMDVVVLLVQRTSIRNQLHWSRRTVAEFMRVSAETNTTVEADFGGDL